MTRSADTIDGSLRPRPSASLPAEDTPSDPQAPASVSSLVAAQRFTRRLARSHYENFIVGGLLTPRALRQDFYNIYAYCRIADDLADEIDDPAESLRQLDRWEAQLDDCYQGRPVRHPVFVALRPTIERFAIPADPFRQLLVAFRQDQRVQSYATGDQLLQYCRSSANPVGHLVLYLGECFDPQLAPLADRLCTGLQLANFWQDVRRDAQMGRVYIPEKILQRFGVDRSRLADGRSPAGAQEMLRELVDEARQHLSAGLPLADHVPRWLGRNVQLFGGGGLAICQAVADRQFDVWSKRPTVSRLRQIGLMASVWWGRDPRPPANQSQSSTRFHR